MADLSDFKRGQIVGARMVGASVTKTAKMFGVSRGTVSKVLTAFKREGKTSSAKHKSGRKLKLSERDRQTLHQIVRNDCKTTAQKITTDLNEHLQNPVSTKTVSRELHKVKLSILLNNVSYSETHKNLLKSDSSQHPNQVHPDQPFSNNNKLELETIKSIHRPDEFARKTQA